VRIPNKVRQMSLIIANLCQAESSAADQFYTHQQAFELSYGDDALRHKEN